MLSLMTNTSSVADVLLWYTVSLKGMCAFILSQHWSCRVIATLKSSEGFERKSFRVLLIIKNHWSFKNTHESLLSEPLRVAFIKNHSLKISLRYVKVYRVCRISKPI